MGNSSRKKQKYLIALGIHVYLKKVTFCFHFEKEVKGLKADRISINTQQAIAKQAKALRTSILN